MSEVVNNCFQKPFQLLKLAVFNIGEYGFGESEKYKKKSEDKELKRTAVPAHI